MEEAAEAIAANGKQLFVFAPSTGAREVLVEKGFDEAQTVEHLIRNEKLHPKLKDQVLWIDEAGLLDVRSTNSIFEIAKEQNARIVLSGDVRQHASPRRGEAMRILEKEAGLNIARVESIQRQKGKYRKAVELISHGHEIVDQRTGLTGMVAGFDLLDQMGKIKECSAEDRHAILAKDYFNAEKKKQSTLIVAPTHAEGRLATEHIRDELRRVGAIGKESVEIAQLQSMNLSEAEKADAATYRQSEMVLQFHQNVKGNYKRGERYRTCRNKEGQVLLKPLAGGALKPIPLEAADRFEVYAENKIGFSVGDKIRFSMGGKATDRKRQISNGRLDEIRRFDSSGNICLKSGMTISKEYGHLDYGYVVTSHASQGKDRDLAIAAIGLQSLPAVNAKQFYVTVSRGREDVAIYVDDKSAVRRAIQNVGEQLSATELVKQGPQEAHKMTSDQKLEQSAFLRRVQAWWRSRFPQKKVGISAAQSPTTNFNPAPELGRS